MLAYLALAFNPCQLKLPQMGWALGQRSLIYAKSYCYIIESFLRRYHTCAQYRLPRVSIVVPSLHCRKSNIFDNMIAIMEKYSKNLEEIVDERTDQLREEKRRTDELLHQMLPEWVYRYCFIHHHHQQQQQQHLCHRYLIFIIIVLTVWLFFVRFWNLVHWH